MWLLGCVGNATGRAVDHGVSEELSAARAAFNGDGQVILRNVSLQ
eukprot:COSAG02_NODE_47105_length_343_cov_1.274590_1_plen_44_part_01